MEEVVVVPPYRGGPRAGTEESNLLVLHTCPCLGRSKLSWNVEVGVVMYSPVREGSILFENQSKNCREGQCLERVTVSKLWRINLFIYQARGV